jgi:hypothetical protein
MVERRTFTSSAFAPAVTVGNADVFVADTGFAIESSASAGLFSHATQFAAPSVTGA